MKTNSPLRYTVLVIITILAYSGFRALIDRVAFIVSLDKVISTTIVEIWKFLSTPSIFITTMVFCVIWIFRDSIKAIFPKINEISAAGVTAKFNFDENIKNNTSQPEREKLKKSAANTQIGEAIYERLLAAAGNRAVKLLLSIDKKRIDSNELVNEFEKAEIGKSVIQNSNADMKTGFYLGIAQAFVIMVLPFLASMNISEDRISVQFTLKPWVKKRIKTSTNS